ncbi:hypothetical protein Q3G72_034564 [Acer saccharum]|nr:hypothetical protein Q3G72_034564 [Acer saccharum]
MAFSRGLFPTLHPPLQLARAYHQPLNMEILLFGQDRQLGSIYATVASGKCYASQNQTQKNKNSSSNRISTSRLVFCCHKISYSHYWSASLPSKANISTEDYVQLLCSMCHLRLENNHCHGLNLNLPYITIPNLRNKDAESNMSLYSITWL